MQAFGRVVVTHCYDFPEVVVHDPTCPRYNGGVCHPRSTPVPPYSADEAEIVAVYTDMMAHAKTQGVDLTGPVEASDLAKLGSLKNPTGVTGSVAERES